MTQFRPNTPATFLTAFLLLGVISAATVPADLSKYRTIRLGTSLPAVTKQLGANLSEVKTIQRRPALIQELEWRAGIFGSGAQTEPAREVMLRFYEGELF